MLPGYPELDPLNPQEHVREFPHAKSWRTVYESVCFCNRCNMCAQSCPTYRLTQDESQSPRGRNQILRLLLEEKIKPAPYAPQLEKTLGSCLFCGACTAVCAGRTPTAQHLLELRRTLKVRLLPLALQTLLSWLGTHPRLFEFAVRFLAELRNRGAVKMLRFCGLTRLPFLRWVNHADDILPRRTICLKKQLKKAGVKTDYSNPDIFYLPSLEAAYLDSSLGQSALKKLAGHPVNVLFGLSCGLFEYVYGSLRLSRLAARKLITAAGEGSAPVVTDSADVYAFLKNYPALFLHSKTWRRKAERFAARVRFIAQYMPAQNPLPQRAQLDNSALFSFQTEAFTQSEKILRVIFKKNLVQYEYKDTPTPTAGYAFQKGNLAEAVCLERVQQIARKQTEIVVLLNGLAAMELNYRLQKLYPHARAVHIAQL